MMYENFDEWWNYNSTDYKKVSAIGRYTIHDVIKDVWRIRQVEIDQLNTEVSYLKDKVRGLEIELNKTS